MQTERRDFLRQLGLGMIAVGSGASIHYLSPAEAHASGDYEFSVLNNQERTTLGALGEVLLPGSREEGLCEFVDFHLAQPEADCLLMLRYLDVPPPYADFYRGGLAALEQFAQGHHKKAFAACSNEQRSAMVGQISFKQPADWRGPPSPLFYFALRSDAVDVYYGTEKGFERLGVPYMAHIRPPTPW